MIVMWALDASGRNLFQTTGGIFTGGDVGWSIGRSSNFLKNNKMRFCDQGVFKYYISAFLRILNPPPPSSAKSSRIQTPTPLYLADVILEHVVVRVLILFHGLFLTLIIEITNSFWNKIQHEAHRFTLLNLIVDLAPKFDDHNYLLL